MVTFSIDDNMLKIDSSSSVSESEPLEKLLESSEQIEKDLEAAVLEAATCPRLVEDLKDEPRVLMLGKTSVGETHGEAGVSRSTFETHGEAGDKRPGGAEVGKGEVTVLVVAANGRMTSSANEAGGDTEELLCSCCSEGSQVWGTFCKVVMSSEAAAVGC